jgi:hypothetical protein
MKGRALLTPTTPDDFAHLLVACLLHDIGYVRGILKGDSADGYIIDARGKRTNVPRGSFESFCNGELPAPSNSRAFPYPPLSGMMTMKRVPLCALLTSLGSSVIRNICEKRTRFIMSLRRRASTIQTAIRYLNVTSSGRQWIANLYSNVFRAERDLSLSGPER